MHISEAAPAAESSVVMSGTRGRRSNKKTQNKSAKVDVHPGEPPPGKKHKSLAFRIHNEDTWFRTPEPPELQISRVRKTGGET